MEIASKKIMEDASTFVTKEGRVFNNGVEYKSPEICLEMIEVAMMRLRRLLRVRG